MFNDFDIKVTEGCCVISNVVVTTPIAINYSRVDFFPSESLKRNKVLSLDLDLNIIFNLQNGKFLSIGHHSLVFKSSQALPKYGKM